MSDKPIKMLIVEDNPGDARLLRELLGETPSARFELTLAERLSEAVQLLAKTTFDAVILDLRLPDSQGIDTFLRLHEKAPDVPTVVLTGIFDETMAVKAVENGAQDYLVKGHVDGDSLARSIRYAVARHAAEPQAGEHERRARGKVIGFMGAKGGVGTTTVVLSVAAVAARQSKDVIAADIRSCFGTFSVQLGRAGVENLSGLLGIDPQAIDERTVSACLMNLDFGPRILFSPQNVAEFKEITPEHAEAITQALAGMADLVVIDLPSYPCAASEAAVRHCDYVAIVVERDPAATASAKLTVELLKSWGIGAERIGAVVVKRNALSAGPSVKDLCQEIGCSLVGVVPQAADSCMDAQRRGLPLVLTEPESMAAASLTELADRLTAERVVPMSF